MDIIQDLLKYNKCICKHLKKKAEINKLSLTQSKILEYIDENDVYNQDLILMITTHNKLLEKFLNLYNKFMNLLSYIQETEPEIFKLNFDIKKHIIKKKYNIDIEKFDTNIVYYIADKDKKLLYAYLVERKKDLYNKIDKLIHLINRLDEDTQKFRNNLLQL